MTEGRTVFCISDHTGLTAETMAHSLLARFEGVEVHYETRSFVDSRQKLHDVIAEIEAASARGPRAIVFSTLTDPELWQVLRGADGLVLGLFEMFVDQLSAEFGSPPTTAVGAFHGIRSLADYQLRLDAIDFALMTDDGVGVAHYESADVILIGVSRVGKTPTCLYLAMQYGIRASNFPLADADLEERRIPDTLRQWKPKLFGLTIDPIRLNQIRQIRRPDSPYSSIQQCMEEIAHAERLFRSEVVSFLDTTTRSIEEIAATIITGVGLERRID